MTNIQRKLLTVQNSLFIGGHRQSMTDMFPLEVGSFAIINNTCGVDKFELTSASETRSILRILITIKTGIT